MHFEFDKLVKFKDMPYARPDLNELLAKMEELTGLFEEAETAEEQIKIFDQFDLLSMRFETMNTLASIRNSIDMNNEFYETEDNFFNENSPKVALAENKFNKVLLNSRFRNELVENLGQQLFDILQCRLRVISEDVLDLMAEENKLCTAYEKLIASAQIPFEGEVYTLSQLNPKTLVADREERIKAVDARESFFKEKEAEIDEIYDKLVKIRTEIAKKLGFKNFVELAYLRLGRTDYNAEMVKSYRDQVKEDLVPLVNELIEKQRERISISKEDFRFFDKDINFSTGNPKPQGTAEEIIEQAKKMYDELSPETSKFFHLLCDYELMDILSTKGKRGGGYMTMLPTYGVPFLFANFNGTQHDVEVMTHEAGHCFQGYMSRDTRCNQYYNPTLEACEIHSMSMEFLTWPWAKNFFGEDTEKFKYAHLSGALKFVPYGVTVDAFQHFVYEHPEASKEERKEAWRKIEKDFTPWKNYQGYEHLEKGAWWHRQSHIITAPMYYIDYTLAQICALQYWIRANEDREEAWQSYLELCKQGGSKSFLGLLKDAKLRIPFEDSCVKEITEKCKDYLDKVNDQVL